MPGQSDHEWSIVAIVSWPRLMGAPEQCDEILLDMGIVDVGAPAAGFVIILDKTLA